MEKWLVEAGKVTSMYASSARSCRETDQLASFSEALPQGVADSARALFDLHPGP